MTLVSIFQLLYHNVSPGVDYSYQIPYYLEHARESTQPSQHKHTTATNKDTDDSFPASNTRSASQSSERHPTGGAGRHRSALTESRSYFSAHQIQSDVTRHKSNDRRTSGNDRRHSSRRQPVFSSDFKRPR